jgi:hypothetical protein
MKPIRNHLSYANVVATLALVFAMSGGALAATHYAINSTKQINPKVLKRLRGADGAKGATGPEGTTGKVGPAGSTGAPGPEGTGGKAGPAGPTHVASGIVFTPGGVPTIIESNFSPGVEVTVKLLSAGVWELDATGLGEGCPLPALTPHFGTGEGLSVGIQGSGCNPGTSIGVVVHTSDTENREWSFLWVGI